MTYHAGLSLSCFDLLPLAFAGVNAASVDWKLTGDYSTMSGYTAYAILGSTVVTTWDSADAVAAAAIPVGGSAAFSGTSRAFSANATAASDEITKSSANIYFVIVNADKTKFAVTAVQDMAGKVYDPANQESSSGAFSTAGKGLSYSPFGGGSGDVPEPTSGLLLLVGGAMLALRRKQK